MSENHRFVVTAARGTEYLLAKELKYLQLKDVIAENSAVSFNGTLADALNVCIWSRIGIRVLLPIADFRADSNESLYKEVKQIDWQSHMAATNTLAIDYNSINSAVSHSQFGAQLVKDAICDLFREQVGERPSVQREQPDIRINCFAKDNNYTVSIDLSGESLHRRGYRSEDAIAPLKENLAAALLQRAAWVETAKRGGCFFDPMCGSGTLLIEAAMIAADIAPNLNREYFGFLNWKMFDAEVWTEVKKQAQSRSGRFIDKLPKIVGSDNSQKAIRQTREAIAKVGLEKKIELHTNDILKLKKTPAETGLLLTNPPYGERLARDSDIGQLYNSIGAVFKKQFANWQIFVFTGKDDLADNFAIKTEKRYPFYNGPIECSLLHFEQIKPENVKEPGSSENAQMLANRLKKNLRKLKSYFKGEGISCYRLYDADLPEYAAAIDIYENYAHIQEYQPPRTIDEIKAWSRVQDMVAVVSDVMAIPAENIFLKRRSKQKGSSQYSKNATNKRFTQVRENGLQFLVNFTDYLDTGLFIDHRPMRKWILQNSKGKRFLNLFAYTGSVTACAAAGGAQSSVTVDMSNTYLDWGQRNLDINGLNKPEHKFIRANCLEWITNEKRKFDLIFLDPPTFSNSKKMEDTFDVQRDHVELIKDCSKLLSKDGILIFSNNFRGFKMDSAALDFLEIRDITPKTIPKDFARTPKFHQCWEITRK